jgi:hypothetical protein
MLGAQAPGADIHLLFLAVHYDGNAMDIGQPAPLGVLLGVAYAGTVLSTLTANITFHTILRIFRYKLHILPRNNKLDKTAEF